MIRKAIVSVAVLASLALGARAASADTPSVPHKHIMCVGIEAADYAICLLPH